MPENQVRAQVGAGPGVEVVGEFAEADRAIEVVGVPQTDNSTLPDRRIYCYATANAAEGADDRGLPELLERFGSWHDPIPALLEAADPDAVLRLDIYELPPLRSYAKGNVVLVGDAAHAMTPDLGQGGCQALEDAVVLGRVRPVGRCRAARRLRPETPAARAGDCQAIGSDRRCRPMGVSGRRGPAKCRAFAAAGFRAFPVTGTDS